MASESVRVVVRCQPLNDREKALNCKMVVSGTTEEPPEQSTFDGTYFISHHTEQMYNEIAYPLVESLSTVKSSDESEAEFVRAVGLEVLFTAAGGTAKKKNHPPPLT
ncbi:hypothetical protein P4O66_006131 [Electrophorus voltai]|uniref:Kinesin motor domain-containing protein n=1 Tax=Electrophorus voltai TaxID=2609070 RepID=A0AAD9DY92_9TELE|nr:hypothetical protein P4O66_006131 [Electrophorus voltai]